MTRQQVESIRDAMLIVMHDAWKECTSESASARVDETGFTVTESVHAACCRQLASMPDAKGVPFRTSLVLNAQTRLIGVEGRTEHDTALIERALHLLTEALEVNGGVH